MSQIMPKIIILIYIWVPQGVCQSHLLVTSQPYAWMVMMSLMDKSGQTPAELWKNKIESSDYFWLTQGILKIRSKKNAAMVH